MILSGSIWTDGAVTWACVSETAHPPAKVTIAAAAVTANSPVLAISVLPSGSSLVLVKARNFWLRPRQWRRTSWEGLQE